MASVTDYQVLHDGAFELDTRPANQVPDFKRLEFSLPSDFTVGTKLAKPLLGFIIRPETDDVRVGLWVNRDPIKQSTQENEFSWQNGSRIDQALWEIVNGTTFRKGADNEVWFKTWRGRARIRSVVLWYQRGSGG